MAWEDFSPQICEEGPHGRPYKELFHENQAVANGMLRHLNKLIVLDVGFEYDSKRNIWGSDRLSCLLISLRLEVKHRCNQVDLPSFLLKNWKVMFTVVMPATLAQYSKIIQNPNHLELQKASKQGKKVYMGEAFCHKS
ncbi:hypothetical protein NC653_018100 [Populus alba x Populus x berolinensis]|uniref:Uncharacterized protein n=1 Tax=Populus alba x Populus x berolinensis TaxID=444605 RepID=A0AAD6QS83_9ROSI|nr:hypothetical protein NC653_018100 [Populus alba x Populus x berolinensis]